jgi:ABC-type dipeptide/oligopeptide/nickel transport system permease subunit
MVSTSVRLGGRARWIAPLTSAFSRRRPLALLGALILLAWIVIAIAAPLFAKTNPLYQGDASFLAPSGHHWFGTDELGRDVFSRVLYGARISLPYAFILVLLSATIGLVVGAVAGFFGGWVDSVLMRLTDLVFAFPTIILALALVAALGPSLLNAVLALVLVSWPLYARVVRGFVLSAMNLDYVRAARLMGMPGSKVLTSEVLVNVSGPVAVLMMVEFGNAILLLAALSFLGLGARPPAAEWGAMISEGANEFNRWWVGLFPGLAIFTIVMALNFIADGFRDALDPRVYSGSASRPNH